MDEPFAALDEITRFKLNNDLLELWQRERLTVVFVTHSVFESAFLSQRIVVMAARPGPHHRATSPSTRPIRGAPTIDTSPTYNEHCRRARRQRAATMAHAHGRMAATVAVIATVATRLRACRRAAGARGLLALGLWEGLVRG